MPPLIVGLALVSCSTVGPAAPEPPADDQAAPAATFVLGTVWSPAVGWEVTAHRPVERPTHSLASK